MSQGNNQQKQLAGRTAGEDKRQYLPVQSTSAFKYSLVDGQQIKENWLRDCTSVSDYRQKLFQALKDSQSRYLDRKRERRVLNQADNLIPLQESSDFLSVNPQGSNLALEKRRIIKQSRNILKKTLERFMVLDNENLIYYVKETDTKVKKSYQLQGSKSYIEHTSEEHKTKWHDKPEKRYEYRVQILLSAREYKPIFFYTNNLNEAKGMLTKVKAASMPNRQELSVAINQLSIQQRILKFNLIWKRIETAYDQKILKIISFQLLGINLIEVANQAKTQRERLLKYWSNIVSSKEGQAVIRSTFRYGNPKESSEGIELKSSLLVRKQLERLVNLIGTRRLSRSKEVSSHLNSLLKEEEAGFDCSDIKVIRHKGQSNEIMKGTIKIEDQSSLLIRDQGQGNQDLYYEKNGPIRFDLEQVSCIATDKSLLEDIRGQLYRVRIYGRFLSEQIDKASNQNVHPSQIDYDILRRVPTETYTIKIISIEVPLEFANRYHQKADIRVKLRQSQNKDTLDYNFFVRSRPYRIEVPAQLNYIPPNLSIDTESFIFTVEKLNKTNENEHFKLNLTLSTSTIPINGVTKDLLLEQEFISKQNFPYDNMQNKQVKVYDKKGNEFIVNFSMGKNSSTNSKFVDEREGKRLLIGRYVIVDNKMTALVKNVDSDGNLQVQLTKTKEERIVTVPEVVLLEDSGVSVFNIRKLPYLIDQSQYSWVVEFTTTRQKLLNVIQSAIQNRQTAIQYGFRKFQPQLSDRDIEGKLIISVLEGRNFITKDGQSNPYVIVLTKKKQQSQVKGQETDIIQNNSNPSWISNQNPTGKIFEIGVFNKDTAFDEILLLSVMNETQSKADQFIGQAQLNIENLIDINEPAKEICLIVENNTVQNSYGFLIVQTMFVPSKTTRLKFCIKEDLTQFKSPEQYLHYRYLLKLNINDNHQYVVPICQYRPTVLENIMTQQNFVIQSPDKKNQIEQIQQSKLLLSPDKSPDKTSAPQFIQVLNKLSSPEEKTAIALRQSNNLRPEVEEGVIIFKYLWKYRVSEPKQLAFQELQARFWNKFLKEVQGGGDYLSNVDQLDMSFTVNQAGQEEGIEKEEENNSFRGWLQSLGGGGTKTNDLHKDIKFNLIFKGSWEKANNQKYADYYHLLMNGVPDNLRPLIWKDLLRTQIIEYEEQQSLRSLYGNMYNDDLSVYENYKEVSQKSDCLAFRQVDEDIENFEFPKNFCLTNDHSARMVQYSNYKRQMRHILRTVIMWSKSKVINKKPVNFNYTKGVMYIVQRLITLMNEEEAFWVLNGMIRSLPRLYSTDTSSLEGARQSVLRYEMTVFKAILRENQPELCDKLRQLGIPVEHLIYDSIASLYSNFFSSAVVLRLWDLIIFNMSTREKVERRRALWYIMAPAYLILREKATEIINAQTVVQVVDIYNSGCAITYNPDWIVGELKQLVKDTFVRGSQDGQDQSEMNYYQLGLNKVSGFIKSKTIGQQDRAQMLEDLRRKYEADLTTIFDSIQEENKEIGNLLRNVQSKQGQTQYIDYVKWRTHIMQKFKKVALKNSDNVFDALYDYDEPDFNREDLDLSKINVYIHQLSHLPGSKLFKIKIQYGKLSKDGVFLSLEDHFSNDVYNNLKIQQFHIFEYTVGYNSIKFEILSKDEVIITYIFNSQLQEVQCDIVIDLRDINANRFAKKWSIMKNYTLLNDTEAYRTALTQIEISFFLQTHTADQHKQMMSDKNPTMSKFVNSIKRKLPDKIDIFNKKNETEFVKQMQEFYQRIIHDELIALENFLPAVQAKNTVNDNYNFISDSDFGDLSVDNFRFLVQQCFFPEWTDKLDKIYTLLTKSNTDEIISTKGQENETLSMLLTGIKTFNKTATESPDKQSKSAAHSMPFSLRNFLVSLVLMSHCTMNEKFDILYDLFDWNDGAADGLDLNSVYVLIKTIFERNLYYLPSHELYNLVEISFDSSVSSVYAAYWTKEPVQQIQNRSVRMSALLNNTDLIRSEEAGSIDVTEEVQDTLNSYQRMFGTKIVDFNHDSSAFLNIDTLIKNGSQMLELTQGTQVATSYRLVLFCEVSGERIIFQVWYDSEGQLIKNLELVEKDDLDEYLKRNINKLYLQGRSSSISKQEFMQKTANIPFLHDLVRVETFYRDRIQDTLVKKSKLLNELVVIFYVMENLFVFRFSSKVSQSNEGDYRKIENKVFSVSMSTLNDQDVISDIRERILNAFLKITLKEQSIKTLNENQQIQRQIEGSRSFFIRDRKGETWKLLHEFDRLVRLDEHAQNNQIVLLFENSFQAVQAQSINQENQGYDCYSLYKHSDQSYEWRQCKIVRKSPVQNVYGSKAANKYVSKFVYWIEFLHLKQAGKDALFKRNREEILVSARFSREQQRNFAEISQQFILDTYSSNEPIVRNISPMKSKNQFMNQLQEDPGYY